MLSTPETKRLARALIVDYRSIKAELSGKRVKGRAGERIRAALAALQIQSLSATGGAEIGCAPVSQTEAQKRPTDGAYISQYKTQAS